MEDLILYEDNHLVIVNKQAGELVQGDHTGDKPLAEKLSSYIAQRDLKPGKAFIGVAHRLDRPVSGAIAFAKTSKGLSRFNELLRKKAVEKVYWAIVKTAPPKEADVLSDFLKKDERKNKSFRGKQDGGGYKQAVLRYKLLHSSDRYHLLEVRIETGRHHQIRAQLAGIGCPIKGDLKYGFDRSNPDGSISLHSRNLSFVHPIKQEEISIVCPVPDDPLWRFFESAMNEA